MKIVEKYKKISLLLLFTIVGFIVPQFAFAIPDFVINLATLIPFFFLNLLINIGVLMVKLSGMAVNWVLSPTFMGMSYTNPATNPIIATGLSVTQSLVNMILILILIYIALATILRLQEYQAQKLLPVFIVIALLVNFTPVICGVIVDASNIIMNFFVSQIMNGVNTFANNLTPKIDEIGEVFVTSRTWEKTMNIALQKMILLPFLGILSFVLFLFALLFMLRYIVIWILVILSPIAFIAYILPITRNWWKMWWSQFINWCFIGTFASFFLYLSLFFITNIQASIPAPTETTAITSVEFSGVLPYIVGIVFLGIGLVMGLKTSAMGASTVIKFAQSKGRVVARSGAKAGAWVGQRVAQRGIRPLAEKVRLKETAGRISTFAEKTPVVRWFAPEKFRKYGQMRPAVEKAQTNAKNYSSRTLAHRIKTGADTQVDATGNLLEVLDRGDSQDIFNAFRTNKNMTDEQVLKSKPFQQRMFRTLQISENSGHLSSVIRKDPRLAGLLSGQKWAGDYATMSPDRAIQKATSEARRNHINNWEREVVQNKNVMTNLLGRGRESFEAIDSQVKRGQETGQRTIDEMFSEYVDRGPAKALDIDTSKSLNKKDQETLWSSYHEYYKRNHQGQDGYFQALKSQRFTDRGWRAGNYIPQSQRTATAAASAAATTPTPSPSPPPPPPSGRGPGATAASASGLGSKPPAPAGRGQTKTGGKKGKRKPAGRGKS